MRYLIPVIVVCCMITSSAGIAFAQTAGPTPQQLLGIYAQIEIEDSSGNLVSYLETSNVKVLYPDEINQIINENIGQFKKTVINAGGQDVEILQVNDTLVHKSPTIVSLNLISLNTSKGPITLVIANHDGFPVAPGDKMITYWTIVRTAGS